MAHPALDPRRPAWLVAAALVAAAPATLASTAAHGAAPAATNGADNLVGAGGAETLLGMGGADTIRGLDGADIINGNGGDDSVGGGPGDDLIHGGPGQDRINGGQGNDTLSGDRDNDTVTGGLGADRFVFDAKSGSDVITDFDSVNGDRIALPPGADYTVVDAPEGLTLKLTGGGTLTLAGVRFAQLGTWLAGPATTPLLPPTLPTVSHPPDPPRKRLLAVIVGLGVAFVLLLSGGLAQLARGRRRP